EARVGEDRAALGGRLGLVVERDGELERLGCEEVLHADPSTSESPGCSDSRVNPAYSSRTARSLAGYHGRSGDGGTPGSAGARGMARCGSSGAREMAR